jgi:hypothetical protein
LEEEVLVRMEVEASDATPRQSQPEMSSFKCSCMRAYIKHMQRAESAEAYCRSNGGGKMVGGRGTNNRERIKGMREGGKIGEEETGSFGNGSFDCSEGREGGGKGWWRLGKEVGREVGGKGRRREGKEGCQWGRRLCCFG